MEQGVAGFPVTDLTLKQAGFHPAANSTNEEEEQWIFN
jgi:hypothetical protein